MITLRPARERGHFVHGWLDTSHTFSFGRSMDPAHMGFRALRVINEDRVAPGAGFGEHPHADMEIVTYVLSGRLAHRDSLGNAGSLGPGDVQRMTAGRGIEHSEFNPSATEPLHLLQIWIRPARRGLDPSYEQKHFPAAARRDRAALIVSPDGAEGSLRIHQDARVYAAVLSPGGRVTVALPAGRHAWIQVARGDIEGNGTRLRAGDGAAVSDEPTVALVVRAESEVLVFDLA